MAIVSDSEIKSYLETDDVPTEEQFANFIDSKWNKGEAIPQDKISNLVTTLNAKVDKVTGKVLSENDYTTIEKNKLAGIDMATKADLVGGTIPTSQLPAITIGETFTVASQASMLALTAQNGDVAIRTDLASRKFLLTGANATVLANWIEIGGSGGVASVNGQSGAVVLAKADIGLGNVPNTDATNATNINSGTLQDERLSQNVALKNIDNSFTQNQKISKTTPSFGLKDVNGNDFVVTKNEAQNYLTVTNEVFEVGGALSNALAINGENQYIRNTTTNWTFGSQFSVSFWLKQIYVGQPNYTPVLYFTDGTNAMHFSVIGGMRYRYNGNSTVFGGTASSNTWGHYVFVVNGSTLTCYLNGAFQGSGTISGRLSTANKLYVGYQEESNPFYLNYSSAFAQFHIDQLLFYNTLLSQSNITDLYSNGSGTSTLPLASNLRLKYEFNEGLGITVNDGSVTGAIGNLLNSPTWLLGNGKVPTEGALQNAFLIRSKDGIGTGNRGEVCYGDPFGGTIITGRTIKFTGLSETSFGLVYNDGRVLLAGALDNNIDPLQLNGAVVATQFKLSALNTAPASATANGILGEIRVVNGFIYVCVATNLWQRCALATW